MGLSFKNSPLVEIIAEIRWDLPWVNQSSAQSTDAVAMLANQHEEFYMPFGSKVAALGYRCLQQSVSGRAKYRPVYG